MYSGEIDNDMGFGYTIDLPLKEEKEEQRDHKSSSSPTLPADIFYEILSYVALDDFLRRCKWVCRYWNSLAHDSKFKALHCQRTQSVSGFLIQNLRHNRFHTNFISNTTYPSISLDFMPKAMNVMIEASSYQAQGLVCCKAHCTPPRYYVCKPMTQQWTQIPNPKTRYNTEKMAIVVKKSHPLHYKIIRLSWSKKPWGLHCEIFDSKKWAWRMQIENVKLSSLVLLSSEPEVLLHGSLHWLTFGDEQKEIFAFDVDKETWRLISLPQSQLSSSPQEGEEVEDMNCDFRIQKTLVNCEGHLGLLYISGSWMELWRMEDYSEKIWKKKYRVSLEPLNQIVGGGYSILAMETMDIILVETFDEFIWYNCTSGVPTQVMKSQNHSTIFHPIHPLNSDIMPCNLDLPPKEIETRRKCRIGNKIV